MVFYSIMKWNTWNWNSGSTMDISITLSIENTVSLYCFILGDHVLWLDRWSAWMSGSGGIQE